VQGRAHTSVSALSLSLLGDHCIIWQENCAGNRLQSAGGLEGEVGGRGALVEKPGCFDGCQFIHFIKLPEDKCLVKGQIRCL